MVNDELRAVDERFNLKIQAARRITIQTGSRKLGNGQQPADISNEEPPDQVEGE